MSFKLNIIENEEEKYLKVVKLKLYLSDILDSTTHNTLHVSESALDPVLRGATPANIKEKTSTINGFNNAFKFDDVCLMIIRSKRFLG